jgi:glycosidase
MKMNMFTILYSLLLLACSKGGSDNAQPPVTPPVDNNPAQYGTPYASVPDVQDAVIYQVNIRAFSKEANLKGVQNRLDSIRALGVNVVYLLPVYPVGTTRSVNSPYCVKDFTAVNPEFGTLEDLRALVTAAHERQMAVILDWVANHSSWDNSWIANKAWYQQDGSGNIISPPNTGWNDVAQLNYQNQDMRKAMIKAMKQWVYTGNVDGYRCDAADFIPVDFWKQAIDTLRNISTHKLLMLAEGTRSNHFGAGFQMVYGMGYYYNMVNIYGKNKNAQSADSVNTVEYTASTTASRVVRYTSNHDVNNSDGTPLDLFGGKQGALSAFVATAFTNAVPMIYNGQEVACPVKLTYFNNSTTIDWTINPDIKAIYKKILTFRNSSAACRSGLLTSYSNADVTAFVRTLNMEKVLIIANSRNAVVNYTLPAALINTTWKEVVNNSNSVTLNSNLSLQPYEYKVLQMQ